MSGAQTVRGSRRFELLRAPETIGTTLLAVLSVILGLRAVALWAMSIAPPVALSSGIRTPMLPPRLGLPFADGTAASWWLVETLTALVFITSFWYWTHYAKNRVHTRGQAFQRGWAGVIAAFVAANIVRATFTSLLSGDGLISYALMLGANIVVSIIMGLIVGLVIGLVCACIGPPSKEPQP